MRRVAILMGGRSSEHEISLASARSVVDALDPPGTTSSPSRSATTGGGPSEAAYRRRSRRAPWQRRCPSPQPAVRSRRRSRGSRSCCPSSTARSERTERCRACSSWPACRTWAPALPRRPSAWTRTCSRRSCATRASPSRETSRSGTAPTAREPVRFSGVRQASPPRIFGGHHEGPRRGGAARGGRARVPARREGARRGVRHGHRGGGRCAGKPRAVSSLVGEIVVTNNEWYDYEAKYDEGEMDLVIPARITAEQTRRVQELAVQAFVATECEGMARVDCFVTTAGDVLVNELNTIPGFTSTSVYAKLFEESGIAYPDLLDRLDRPRARTPRAPLASRLLSRLSACQPAASGRPSPQHFHRDVSVLFGGGGGSPCRRRRAPGSATSA